MQPPHDGLIVAASEYQRVADQLLAAITSSRKETTFTSADWIAHADLIYRLSELGGEITLQQDSGFLTALRQLPLETINGMGVANQGKPPFFGPDTQEGRRHAELTRLVEELQGELQADPRIPRPPASNQSTNYADWREYRENHLREWNAYADRVRHIRKLFFQFLKDNILVIYSRVNYNYLPAARFRLHTKKHWRRRAA